MKTIKEWITDIHANAKNKGWWETARPIVEVFNLMHCELSEAVEEDRAGKGNFYIDNGKPEGVFIELIDCVIRMFDYIGSSKKMPMKFEEYYDELKDKTPLALSLNKLISAGHYALIDWQYESDINLAVEFVAATKYYIETNGGNFWELLKLKHEFNKTRPYKHNKRY